jgi:hypothetical protein
MELIMKAVELRARVKEQKQAEKQAKLVYRGVAYLKNKQQKLFLY